MSSAPEMATHSLCCCWAPKGRWFWSSRRCWTPTKLNTEELYTGPMKWFLKPSKSFSDSKQSVTTVLRSWMELYAFRSKGSVGFKNRLVASRMYKSRNIDEKKSDNKTQPLNIILLACKVAQELLLWWWGSVNDNNYYESGTVVCFPFSLKTSFGPLACVPFQFCTTQP